MGRKKVKLQWIVDDSARKATFNKRRQGLIKKVSQLSTLCGLSMCAIVYGPYEPTPEIWPNNCDANAVLTRFKCLPEFVQSKLMMNQESFLDKRINKMIKHVEKQQKVNRQCGLAEIINQVLIGRLSINDVGREHLTNLTCMVEERMKAVKDQIELLHTVVVPISSTPPLPPVVREYGSEVANFDGNHYDLGKATEELNKKQSLMEIMKAQEQDDEVVNMIRSFAAHDYDVLTNGFIP